MVNFYTYILSRAERENKLDTRCNFINDYQFINHTWMIWPYKLYF